MSSSEADTPAQPGRDRHWGWQLCPRVRITQDGRGSPQSAPATSEMWSLTNYAAAGCPSPTGAAACTRELSGTQLACSKVNIRISERREGRRRCSHAAWMALPHAGQRSSVG